jgi:hypothetical protein
VSVNSALESRLIAAVKAQGWSVAEVAEKSIYKLSHVEAILREEVRLPADLRSVLIRLFCRGNVEFSLEYAIGAAVCEMRNAS